MGRNLNTPEHSVEDEDEDAGVMVADMDEDEMIIIDDDDPIEEGDPDSDDANEDYVMEDSALIDPPRDDASIIFSGHSESVFSVAVDPVGRYIVSGSQDHTAILWDLSSGKELFKCTGHDDSVTCVTFSSDGRYLATGDMNGLIQVWKFPKSKRTSSCSKDCQSPAEEQEVTTSLTPELVWSESVHELQWLKWHPLSPAVLIAGSGGNDGSICVWAIASKHAPKYLPGVGAVCVAGEIMPDGTHLVALYDQGQLRIWDIKSCTSTKCIPLSSSSGASDGHPLCPVCLSCRKEGDIAAVGAQGMLIIVNLKGQRADVRHFTIEDDSTIESLAFSSTHPFLGFGTVNGLIGVFDTHTMQLRHSWLYNSKKDSGISRILWSNRLPVFFTAGLDGRLCVWDGRTSPTTTNSDELATNHSGGTVLPLAEWFGHRAMILDCQFAGIIADEESTASQDSLIATSSDDATVRLFNLTQFYLSQS